mmetsp:Transcript_6667/g.5788  ORF Transcript_6667/g.5788 Transcript_6667/m.5788 type:complete len:145 (+) Transcript_6667:251-685(+)
MMRKRKNNSIIKKINSNISETNIQTRYDSDIDLPNVQGNKTLSRRKLGAKEIQIKNFIKKITFMKHSTKRKSKRNIYKFNIKSVNKDLQDKSSLDMGNSLERSNFETDTNKPPIYPNKAIKKNISKGEKGLYRKIKENYNNDIN